MTIAHDVMDIMVGKHDVEVGGEILSFKVGREVAQTDENVKEICGFETDTSGHKLVKELLLCIVGERLNTPVGTPNETMVDLARAAYAISTLNNVDDPRIKEIAVQSITSLFPEGWADHSAEQEGANTWGRVHDAFTEYLGR